MPKKLANGSQPANGDRQLPLADRGGHHQPVAATLCFWEQDTLAFSFHKSHAPVFAAGTQANAANISLPDGKRYFVSIVPDSGYTIGGAPIANGQGSATVICNQLPLPTAQITVFAFHDNNPINNAPDATEPGLEGFKVIVEDSGGRYGISGGHQLMDAFGNMIGTTYQQNPNGSYDLDAEGNPIVLQPARGSCSPTPPAMPSSSISARASTASR